MHVFPINDRVIIGFSTTNHFMSRVIRFFTRSKVSHAWVGYWDDTLRQHMVLQAEATGFEAIPWFRWIRKNKMVAAFYCREQDLLDQLRGLARKLGVGYDYLSALLVGLRAVFRRKLRRPFASSSKLMCSEAVIRLLQDAGIESVSRLDPETTSPGVLLEILDCDLSFRKIQTVESEPCL